MTIKVCEGLEGEVLDLGARELLRETLPSDEPLLPLVEKESPQLAYNLAPGYSAIAHTVLAGPASEVVVNAGDTPLDAKRFAFFPFENGLAYLQELGEAKDGFYADVIPGFRYHEVPDNENIQYVLQRKQQLDSAIKIGDVGPTLVSRMSTIYFHQDNEGNADSILLRDVFSGPLKEVSYGRSGRRPKGHVSVNIHLKRQKRPSFDVVLSETGYGHITPWVVNGRLVGENRSGWSEMEKPFFSLTKDPRKISLDNTIKRIMQGQDDAVLGYE